MGKSGKSAKKPIIEDDEEVYHVEVITKARVAPVAESSSGDEDESSVSGVLRKKKRDKSPAQARWEYWVKWAGYDTDANSWEPEENVADCQRLLSSFWDHIGMDNEDYPVGYEVHAKESWIKKEKSFFAKEYKGLQEQMKNRKKQVKKSSSTHSLTASSSAKGKQKAADIELTSSSGSDDDQPLSQTIVPAKRKSISSDEEHESKPMPPSKIQRMGSSARKVTLQGPLPPEADQGPSADSLFTPSPPQAPPKPLPVKAYPIPLPPPAKRLPVPIKFRRPPNRHADIAAGTVDPTFFGSGAAISTKQRLAQQALTPVLPKNPLASPVESDRMRPPSLASTKHAIRELSFKKNPSTISPRTPNAANATTEAAAGPSTLNDSVLPPSISRVLPQPMGFRGSNSLSGNRASESTDNEMEAVALLGSIIPQMATPLTPTFETEQGPLPPKPLVSRVQPPPTKIQKKWKWSGPFILEHSDGHTEPFDVNIQDCTEPVSAGLRFSIILNGVEKLVAQSFHGIADVATFLRACQPASQLGRLVARDPQDLKATAALTTLSLYMAKRKQVILIPATLDEEIVGHMFIFTSDKDLNQRFNVPSDLLRPQSLVVSLLPWELSTKQISMDWREPVSSTLRQVVSIQPTIPDFARWERSIRSKVSYHHALRLLQFPKDLHDFMVREQGRTFCVWWDGGDNTNIKSYAGIETNYLMSVMEQCRAGHVPTKPTVARVVFIHVGALKTVHKLPSLSERRGKHPSVRFYTYGTHESVTPHFWGIREIWPCGGVITFTPQAALDDFLGLLHLIRQACAHPLWTSYVLPSVVGMVAKLLCAQEDPLVVYDRGEFVFKELLELIVDGELAMITAPRNDRHPTSASALSQHWLDEFVISPPGSGREILQYAITSFNAKYSKIHTSEWMRAASEEISADMTHMHRQPAFMKDYRRYAVLRGNRQEISLPDDGLEWVMTANFDFRDEFYPKQ